MASERSKLSQCWDFLKKDQDENKSSDVHNSLTPDSGDLPKSFASSDTANEVKMLTVCLEYNEVCDDHLRLIERNVCDMLDNVRTGLRNIEEQLRETEKKGINSFSFRAKGGSAFDPSCQFFSSPPPNKDTIERTKKGYLNYLDLPSTRLWKEEEITKLENSIKNAEIEARLKEAKKVETVLEMELAKCNDAVNQEKLRIKLDKCRHYCSAIKNMPLKDLVACSKVGEYDWLKIAVVDLLGMRTDSECRLMWLNYLHPNINKSEWTEAEDSKLQALAEKYRYQDWDIITKELGTKRSAYQCACRYHRYLNKTMRNSKWTPEDDKALQNCIQKFQIGSYIPWQKVAYYMENRTKLQLYNRWCYSLDPSIQKGRFTKEEDIVILAGIRKYGKDFSQISQFLHGRTSVQVRDRYNTIVQYMNPSGPWTEEEDILLLELVQKYGQGNWSKISQHFNNRNRTQIRHHYSTMQKWMNSHPGRDPCSVNKRRTIQDSCGSEKMWEGVRTVIRKRKIVCKGKAEHLEVDMNLLELKQRLGLGGKRRGRKVGQKKTPGVLDKQYVNFFRCAYMQHGGRRKVRYDEFHVKNRASEMGIMLDSLMATLEIPSDSVLARDESLSQMDKYILQSLRDKKADQTSGRNAPYPHQTYYYYPPNHTTILGFRTLLLSHCNINEDANQYYGKQGQTKSSDEEHKAVSLWKKRFVSLFRWASCTSITGPNMLEDLFPETGGPVASLVECNLIPPTKPQVNCTVNGIPSVKGIKETSKEETSTKQKVALPKRKRTSSKHVQLDDKNDANVKLTDSHPAVRRSLRLQSRKGSCKTVVSFL